MKQSLIYILLFIVIFVSGCDNNNNNNNNNPTATEWKLDRYPNTLEQYK